MMPRRRREVDDLDQQRRLGPPRITRAGPSPQVHRAPATTRVLGITINVGKTGALTPARPLERWSWRRQGEQREPPQRGRVRKKGRCDRRHVLIEARVKSSPISSSRPLPAPVRRRAVSLRRCARSAGARRLRPREAIWRCTTPPAPQLKERLFPTSARAGHGHRAPRRGRDRPDRDRAWVKDFADLYDSRPSLADLERSPRSREQPRRGDRRLEDARALDLLNGLGIRMVGERAAQLLPRASAHGKLLAATEQDQRDPRHRPADRASGHALFAEFPNRTPRPPRRARAS